MENKKIPSKRTAENENSTSKFGKGEKHTLSLHPPSQEKNFKFAVIIKDGKKNKIAGIGNELKKVDSMSRKIN